MSEFCRQASPISCCCCCFSFYDGTRCTHDFPPFPSVTRGSARHSGSANKDEWQLVRQTRPTPAVTCRLSWCTAQQRMQPQQCTLSPPSLYPPSTLPSPCLHPPLTPRRVFGVRLPSEACLREIASHHKRRTGSPAEPIKRGESSSVARRQGNAFVTSHH